MSIHGDDFSQHLTVTAPAATTLPGGDFTIGCLYKNPPPAPSTIWCSYQSNNFSKQNMYFDGDFWYDFDQWDSSISTTSRWMWIVVTKSSANEPPRVHQADYSETGSLSWIHGDVNTSEPGFGNINRFCIGDEFGNGFKGDLATLVAYQEELDDAGVEARFLRSSPDLFAASPVFFMHFPEAEGLSNPFSDLAGGGVETIRTGSWSMSDDPPGYIFALGRSGKPKVWNGTTWDQHPAKVWNGSAWVTHPMKGHDGSSFITAK